MERTDWPEWFLSGMPHHVPFQLHLTFKSAGIQQQQPQWKEGRWRRVSKARWLPQINVNVGPQNYTVYGALIFAFCFILTCSDTPCTRTDLLRCAAWRASSCPTASLSGRCTARTQRRCANPAWRLWRRTWSRRQQCLRKTRSATNECSSRQREQKAVRQRVIIGD